MHRKAGQQSVLLTCRKEGTVVPLGRTVRRKWALDNRPENTAKGIYHREHTIFYQKMQQKNYLFSNMNLRIRIQKQRPASRVADSAQGFLLLQDKPGGLWLHYTEMYGRICSEQHIWEVMTTQKHLGHYFKVMDLRMEHSINMELQKLDLTSAQGHIIGYLTHAKEPPCARDLEKYFRLSHPTVSGLLSRMEAKGFIGIRPDPEDRRVKRIVLLEKGMACSRQIERCIRENNLRMIRGFSPEEEELFRQLLKRAVDNMIDDARSSEPNREE